MSELKFGALYRADRVLQIDHFFVKLFVIEHNGAHDNVRMTIHIFGQRMHSNVSAQF